MKDIWKTFKLGIYVFALPLVATAAASAHQWITNSAPVTAINLPAATSSTAVARIDMIRNHTVTINDKGEVEGRIATIDPKTSVAYGLSNLNVYFVQNGEIVRKTTANEDGSFVAKGLSEGIYSFIAAGESGFATYGVNVVKAVGETQNYMEAAAVSPNVKPVRKIISENMPESVVNEVTADLAKTQSLQPTEFAGSNCVELTDSGLMNGRVISFFKNELQGMYAYILQGDKEISKVAIDSQGKFSVNDMKPGVYDLVAAGPDGVAAVSFEAVAPAREGVTEAYTSLQDPVAAADTMDVALSAPQDYGVIDGAGFVDNSIVYDGATMPIEYAGECVSCGVAAGSSCGGCGDFAGYSSSGVAGGGGGYGGFGGVSGGGFIGRRLGLIGIALGAVGIALGAGDGGGGGGTQSPDDT